MHDVEDGLVDVIVVYKLDRITRTLVDFVRLIDFFDRYGVGFVSITQSFDTSDSLGRLILNVLLTFASSSAKSWRTVFATSCWYPAFGPMAIRNDAVWIFHQGAHTAHQSVRSCEGQIRLRAVCGSGELLGSRTEVQKAAYKTTPSQQEQYQVLRQQHADRLNDLQHASEPDLHRISPVRDRTDPWTSYSNYRTNLGLCPGENQGTRRSPPPTDTLLQLALRDFVRRLRSVDDLASRARARRHLSAILCVAQMIGAARIGRRHCGAARTHSNDWYAEPFRSFCSTANFSGPVCSGPAA